MSQRLAHVAHPLRSADLETWRHVWLFLRSYSAPSRHAWGLPWTTMGSTRQPPIPRSSSMRVRLCRVKIDPTQHKTKTIYESCFVAPPSVCVRFADNCSFEALRGITIGSGSMLNRGDGARWSELALSPRPTTVSLYCCCVARRVLR